ncbi:hypothetical protein O6H91_Y311900 [Diphasiastrum complanatum]|nr:hypothetical protein O6H91_Y311900 [Diphasiastrum complanatum]
MMYLFRFFQLLSSHLISALPPRPRSFFDHRDRQTDSQYCALTTDPPCQSGLGTPSRLTSRASFFPSFLPCLRAS